MAQPDQSEAYDNPHAIPTVTPEVLENFRRRRPTFKELGERLRQRNRLLADYVFTRAEQLAPGARDMRQKEAVARLALEMYMLLDSQAQANGMDYEFRELTDLPDLISGAAGEDSPPAT